MLTIFWASASVDHCQCFGTFARIATRPSGYDVRPLGSQHFDAANPGSNEYLAPNGIVRVRALIDPYNGTRAAQSDVLAERDSARARPLPGPHKSVYYRLIRVLSEDHGKCLLLASGCMLSPSKPRPPSTCSALPFEIQLFAGQSDDS